MSSALILIDVQNTWADDNPRTTHAIAHCVARLRAEMPVIWVYMKLFALSTPFQARDMGLAKRFNGDANGVRAIDLLPAITPDPKDWVFTKSSRSFLENPHAQPFLREQGINTVFLAGFKASDCVFASARDTAAKGLRTHIISDLSADSDDCLECEGKEYFERGNIRFKSLSSLGYAPKP